jgi:predicted DsbA family dithiol-disulfide isomerase
MLPVEETVETVKFHFDFPSHWCYQASRWIRRLEELGVLEADWGVFSLDVANTAEGIDSSTIHAESGPALRTAIKIRDLKGSTAMGAFYQALGATKWIQIPPLVDLTDAVREALAEIGLDPSLLDDAMADPATWDAVVAETRGVLDNTRASGVPTIVLDGGTGPAIFGPVISALPDDDDAVKLWEHVSWLARYENFAELKRGRISLPVLPARDWWVAYRQQQRERAAAQG